MRANTGAGTYFFDPQQLVRWRKLVASDKTGPAIAALVTTLHDVVLVVGWFALTGHEFDLTVLAGILSVMGYSINDTIVVFDRIRENLKLRRRDTEEATINTAVNQVLSRTIVTSLTVVLVLIPLIVLLLRAIHRHGGTISVDTKVGEGTTFRVLLPTIEW